MSAMPGDAIKRVVRGLRSAVTLDLRAHAARSVQALAAQLQPSTPRIETSESPTSRPVAWRTSAHGVPLVDLDDREAVRRALAEQ